MDSDCLAAMDHVYAFPNGELDDRCADYAMVKHHLAHCESCFSRAEMERILGEKLKKEKAPEELKWRPRKLIGDL